jgi:uncharacterized protein (TIGR00369 family)
VGLHGTFTQSETGEALATFIPSEHHEGWPGIVHGGVLTTLMDEAMAYALWFRDHRAVTARMDTRFRRQVSAGEELRITASVVGVRRGIIDAKARISLVDGTVVAEATARFVPAEVSYS